MRSQKRLWTSRALAVCSGTAFAVAVVAFWDNPIPLGRGYAVWLSQAEVRVCWNWPGAESPIWRSHPLEVRYKRVGGGWLAEVGSYPLGGVACVLCVAAYLSKPRRPKAGMCPVCEYDVAQLAAGARCPECGAEQVEKKV